MGDWTTICTVERCQVQLAVVQMFCGDTTGAGVGETNGTDESLGDARGTDEGADVEEDVDPEPVVVCPLPEDGSKRSVVVGGDVVAGSVAPATSIDAGRDTNCNTGGMAFPICDSPITGNVEVNAPAATGAIP